MRVTSSSLMIYKSVVLELSSQVERFHAYGICDF